MYEIISIGSATRDVFIVSKAFHVLPDKQSSNGIYECVSLGSKIDVDELVLTTGGGATNTVTTFARLGFKTTVVTRIGNDRPGLDIIDDLKANRVNYGLIQKIKNGQTGYSTILTMLDGERTILVYRGVSSSFTSKDIPWNKLNTKWIYLSSLGGNLALSKKIIKFATKKKITLAWNPGKKELESGLKTFIPILSQVDVFIVNREEAQILTGQTQTDFQKLLHILSVHTKGLVVITDGPKGAYAFYEGKDCHVATTGVKSISQTGAGDAFGSGLVSGLMKGLPCEDALRLGILNAESVIQHIGAKKGILSKWPSEKTLKTISIS